MKTMEDILSQLEDDMTEAIPPLVLAKGLTEFDFIGASHPRDVKDRGIFLYENTSSYDARMSNAALLIQLQLPGASVQDAAKYRDILVTYLISYPVRRLGAVYLDSINVDTWPPDTNRTTYIFVDMAVSEPLDSCD